MEQKRTGLSYVFTLARGERGKLGVGLLAVLCSALSLIPYLVVYQILLLIIQSEVTFGAMAMWASIGIAAAIGQAILMSFAGICSHVAAFNTMHKIKVKVLENSEYSAREAADILCEALDCECVQVIGRKFVLFKQKKKESAYTAVLAK